MRDELMREWVMTWIEVGQPLGAVKRRRLEAMTDEDVRHHVRALFPGWSPSDIAQVTESGLVQQQRWFARAHRST
jgi:hypothetical protein